MISDTSYDNFLSSIYKELNMAKEKSPKKSDKKPPLLTAKEKKAAKRAKKNGGSI
jgi:hypothetical protein